MNWFKKYYSTLFLVLIIVVGLGAFIKYQIDKCNIEKRGVEGVGVVFKIISYKRISYYYIVDDMRYEKTKKITSHNLNEGDKIKIIYDSLDVENCRIIWRK